ncbi:MAG TPA: hypothetical protein VE031_06770 [Chthoniobacterales bacterium]|nr:hypothetical protein [Chthoniobacterales bacterium]
MVIEIFATISWVAFGIILTFWHRSLMVSLHELSPNTWAQLSDGWLFRQVWNRSLQLPFWSWRSLAFFVFGRYKTIPSPSFTRKADSFRFALIAWLVGVFTPVAVVLLMRAPFVT